MLLDALSLDILRKKKKSYQIDQVTSVEIFCITDSHMIKAYKWIRANTTVWKQSYQKLYAL